ncbi:hypothetical protein [Flectobacillus roseus]|uniref:Uncharacterized protein n=1 Tax=Flectobacillus roseus TaxID=502259 RepID=A0ABT6YDV8_9BACT|nr:hypothetical protein [Flectobacillus roseus]MDI9861612.1 hypothetical protein [Flectobacillus roseus]
MQFIVSKLQKPKNNTRLLDPTAKDIQSGKNQEVLAFVIKKIIDQ